MTRKIKLNHFDRSKEFYPLIISFVCSTHGLLDLISRGIVDTVNENLPKDAKVNLLSHSSVGKFIDAKKTPQIGQIGFRSDYQGEVISIDLEEISKDIFDNYNHLLNSGVGEAPARMLLISAYEIKKDEMVERRLDKDELWQFFRHVRNAAAHNGKFYFSKNEPKYISKWGEFIIDSSLRNRKLFRTDKQDGFLSGGDSVRLLWEIEQKFFTL